MPATSVGEESRPEKTMAFVAVSIQGSTPDYSR